MRLTRAGWAVLVVAAATLLLARTVQVAQIWMIGTGLSAAVLLACVTVAARPAPLAMSRRIEPTDLQVGAPAHMVLHVTVVGSRRAPSTVVEQDGRRWRLPPLPPGSHHDVALDLSTRHRGVVHLGPVLLHRSDPLDLTRRSVTVCPARELVVAPRSVHLDMVRPGVGVVGAMLTQRARQFGVSEFEGLRHYVEGDDLRLVHWKASARSTELLVKEFSLDGARRCTVVLDTSTRQTHEELELAVSTATSLVLAAHRADLALRLVTTGGVDLPPGTRAEAFVRALALVTPDAGFTPPRRDPSEGLGLVVCVTPQVTSDVWRLRDSFTDPLLVNLAVVQRGGGGPGVIHAPTLERLATAWNDAMRGAS